MLLLGRKALAALLVIVGVLCLISGLEPLLLARVALGRSVILLLLLLLGIGCYLIVRYLLL